MPFKNVRVLSAASVFCLFVFFWSLLFCLRKDESLFALYNRACFRLRAQTNLIIGFALLLFLIHI